MKIVKIYCDCCLKEVTNEDCLYFFPILNTTMYNYDGRIKIKDQYICLDCLEKLSNEFNKLNINSPNTLSNMES